MIWHSTRTPLRQPPDQSLLTSPHRRRDSGVVFCVIVAEHVKRAVDDESRQLFANGHTIIARRCASDLWRNVHVTDHRPALPLAREAECDDVRRPRAAEVLPIERGYTAIADERDRQQTVSYPFGAQYRAR